MSRSTRSSARKSTSAQEEVEDSLIEDGFSVVDTDKSQKGKDGKAKKPSENSVETAKPVTEKESQPAKMEVDQTPQAEPEQKDGENGNDPANSNSQSGIGDSESVAEAAVKQNGDAEEAKEEQGTGEEAKEKTEESGQESENQENKEKTEGTGGDPQPEEKDKKPKHPIVWVSNISRHVKATDLKKHFSKHGKVVTAKIVTNGKSFFGYVCLDSLEAVEVCVKNLNNSDFEGRKISVTVDKPLRDDKVAPRKKVEEVAPTGKDPLTTSYDGEKKGEHVPKEKERDKKDSKKKIDTSKMTVEELRKEVALCEREIDRLRSRLIEEQARGRTEIKRCRRLERELGDCEMKMRDDRKRYERDREEWVKKNRLEHLRIDADRVIMERERQELRRAREEFERDLRRFIEDQQRAALERPRESPHNPLKRFRPDDGPGEPKSSWISESAPSGGQRDGQGPPRGGQLFSWSSNQGGSGSGGGSQWRNMGGSGSGSQPPYFRGDSYRPTGSFPGGANDGGFRGGPYENAANRKF